MDRRTTVRALAGVSVLLLAGCDRDEATPAAQAERAPTTATQSSVPRPPAPAAGAAAMTAREARPLARVDGRALYGIGDAAYYGGFLPSAALSGDVLLEFAMPLLPDEQRSFLIRARTAVGRL